MRRACARENTAAGPAEARADEEDVATLRGAHLGCEPPRSRRLVPGEPIERLGSRGAATSRRWQG